VHVELEVKFFLALVYVVMQDFDLANQLILSLQRQLRKDSMSRYEKNGKPLLKVLSTALGGKPNTRERNLRKYIDQYNEGNKGRYGLLRELDLEAIFLKEETVLSIG